MPTMYSHSLNFNRQCYPQLSTREDFHDLAKQLHSNTSTTYKEMRSSPLQALAMKKSGEACLQMQRCMAQTLTVPHIKNLDYKKKKKHYIL